MKILRNVLLLALILLLSFIALDILVSNVFPFVLWILKVVVSLVLLIAIGFAVVYLYRKLRA